MHDSLLVSRDDCTEWKKKKFGREREREGEGERERGRMKAERSGVAWRGAGLSRG